MPNGSLERLEIDLNSAPRSLVSPLRANCYTVCVLLIYERLDGCRPPNRCSDVGGKTLTETVA